MNGSVPRLADYGLLLLLAAFWGGSFMLIKLAVDEIPPASLSATRLIIGGMILFAVVLYTGERARYGGRSLGLIVLAGFIGNAVPFVLISWGEKTVDAGLASILMGIMPIATLVLAHFFTGNEPMTLRKLSGVVIGLAGLVILVGPAVLLRLGDEGISQLAILGAAVCYSVNAIMTKALLDFPRTITGAAILLAGGLTTLPVALLFEQPWALDPGVMSTTALVLLSVFPTAIAMLLIFEVLDRQGAGFFSQVNLLVPLFGVAWAALVLGEIPNLAAIFALMFILAGIYFARGGGRTATAGAPSTQTEDRIP